MLLGAIEAGGTKFVCAVSDENLNIIDRVKIPTETPTTTMAAVFEFFDKYDLHSMGVASFGPIDVNEGSEKYGHITNTPKLAWRNFNFLKSLKDKYQIPIYWTTDVNGSAYGEYKLGVAKDLESVLYLTVGTGMGGGLVNSGKLFTGLTHLEVGHIIVRRHPDDEFEGICPIHGDCLEGLISGPAVEARFNGQKAVDISLDEPVWDHLAYYLAQALRNYTLTLMPHQIIIGGGIMKKPGLIDKVQSQFKDLWRDYIDLPNLDQFIVLPGLGDDAGIIGCLVLAKELLEK